MEWEQFKHLTHIKVGQQHARISEIARSKEISAGDGLERFKGVTYVSRLLLRRAKEPEK